MVRQCHNKQFDITCLCLVIYCLLNKNQLERGFWGGGGGDGGITTEKKGEEKGGEGYNTGERGWGAVGSLVE